MKKMLNQISKTDFDKICRTCLQRNEKMHELCTFAEVLSELADIKLQNDLPKNICYNCVERAQSSYEFKQQCIGSDEILLQITLQDELIKNESVSQEEDSVEPTIEASKEEKIQKDENEFDSDESDHSYGLNDNSVESVSETFNEQEGAKENEKTDEDETNQIDIYVYQDTEDQKQSALERAIALGPEKCDPETKTCKICGKLFFNIHSLIRHVSTHDANRQIVARCTICDKGFYEKKHITNHMLRHKGEGRFKCIDCAKPFYELNALRGHVKLKHPKQNIVCTECEEVCILQQDMDMHMKTHKKNQFTCSDCGKEFLHRYLLRKHQWMHAKERKFYCNQCEKSFKSKQVLHLHVKRCHSEEKKLEICNICGKSVVYLKNHIYIHSNVRYKCEHCLQEFTNKFSLNKHLKRKHSNIDEKTLNPYLCNICGKRAENLTMLNRHIRTHSNERNHKCPICLRLYKSAYLVSSHIRYTHNNIRNYKCDNCEKTFHTSSGLKLHLRIHSGERPYKCDNCGKQFRQKSTLRTHIKIHERGSQILE